MKPETGNANYCLSIQEVDDHWHGGRSDPNGLSYLRFILDLGSFQLSYIKRYREARTSRITTLGL